MTTTTTATDARNAATARIATILGGDLRAARRVVSRLSPVQRWVAGGGDAEARAVLGSYAMQHGKPRVRVKAGAAERS